MKKILLACSSGMSTSLLVTKMKEYAQSIGEEAEIWAVGQDKAKEDMRKANAVLIGPQMSFLKSELQKEADQYNIRVEVIDMMAYGMADGKKAYEQALSLMENQ
ncbi:PTS sugar transporter subunit IIB [Bacillus subtilis]|uniref:PTS sugar transporter subunit IIB n=1 Tax=Bacillus subtilis TaxID=1423 RepID=UPI00156082BA|nr:PTS sugar transporter subunit IIB [Bacillus subtilis]NRF44148.1 PTS sugar transporter subunit IIB [Bacillus subtilis]